MTVIYFVVWWINGYPSIEFTDPNSWAIWLLATVSLDLFFST